MSEGLKITQLPVLEDPSLDDVIAIVHDPTGSPRTYEVTVRDVLALVGGGTQIFVGPEPPEDPEVDDFWFDTDDDPSGTSVQVPLLYKVTIKKNDPGGYDLIDEIFLTDVQAPPASYGVGKTISGGPFTLPAGGHVYIVGAVVSSPVGCILADEDGNSEMTVSNAAGTQKIVVESVGADLLTEPLALNPSAVDEHIGSDLTVDGSGHIITAAGGQFFVTFAFGARYTAPPA